MLFWASRLCGSRGLLGANGLWFVQLVDSKRFLNWECSRKNFVHFAQFVNCWVRQKNPFHVGFRFTDKSPHDFCSLHTLSKRFWPFSPERFPGLNISQWKRFLPLLHSLRRGTKTCWLTPPDNQGFRPHTLRIFLPVSAWRRANFYSKYSWGELLTSPWFMNNCTTSWLCATFTHTLLTYFVLLISTPRIPLVNK